MAMTLTRILRLCFASIFLWLFFRASPYYAKFNIEDSTGSDCGGQAHVRFSWESIVPTEQLIWTECYSENQLPRADTRQPPGGPGGSGVDLVLKAGPLLSTILGPGFDIIGFDPRAGERDDGSLRFINTENTARDMLRIVQAHALEKIQYWGFSNLFDTDKVWVSFVDGCVAAGPQGCAFFAPTATEILDNVDKIYASLRARPIPVWTNGSYGVVDYSLLRRAIFKSFYTPYAHFPILARALAELSVGNGTVEMARRPYSRGDSRRPSAPLRPLIIPISPVSFPTYRSHT
ncbi:hypothetical protein DFH08DRAFT_795785 [Mycena albidolilacea]|uniref:Uncharacterized protein n=1 Tax=Mycena albidolilacea TaxID=1033008 RepID=A0AAD7AT71_9AGAR|nr:hypothetical protein DFH08DRAFT_795785 [Mycena albidolilacea]